MTSHHVTDAVARVEAELASFWSAPEMADGTPMVKVRASTMNFVVIASPPAMERLRDATEDLAQTHAGRSFLLQLDGRLAPWDASTDIHAVCRIDGSVPICYDRVEIAFGAMAAQRAASIVRALALSEVPVVAEAAAGAPSLLVDEIAPVCDRLVVDSATMPMTRVAELTRRAGGPVADRAFVRIFSWRELVSRFFDDARPALRAIKRVEIGRTPIAAGGRQGSASAAPKQEPAALLLGWLSSRLGWTFASRAEAKDAEGRSIEIALSEDGRPDVGPGTLTSIRIWTDLDGEALELGCERTDAPGIVRWSMKGARNVTHDHPLGFRDETWVLVKAIDSREGDKIYREAALAAAEWSSK